MKKIISSLLLLVCASCASTHGNFITENRDAWIDGYSAKSNGADRGLLFCRANVKDDGLADPVCFETRFEEYDDEKSRIDDLKKKEEKNKKKDVAATKEAAAKEATSQ